MINIYAAISIVNLALNVRSSKNVASSYSDLCFYIYNCYFCYLKQMICLFGCFRGDRKIYRFFSKLLENGTKPERKATTYCNPSQNRIVKSASPDSCG